jgi:hypothetical protein
MRSIRRGSRILITQAGPATFEIQWKRDTQYIIPLLEEDQSTGQIIALHSFSVASIFATARKRPYQSDFVKTWNVSSNLISAYSEVAWNIGAGDLDALTWLPGQTSQVLFLDFVASKQVDATTFTRALEDADGNFVFPLRVFQAMSEVP